MNDDSYERKRGKTPPKAACRSLAVSQLALVKALRAGGCLSEQDAAELDAGLQSLLEDLS